MDNVTTDWNEKDPDEIRKGIEATRASLTEKLETLEVEVQETVKETVREVKDTFTDTVEDVKRVVDVRTYIKRYPWAFVSGAVVTGLVTGGLLKRGTPKLKKRISAMRNRNKSTGSTSQMKKPGLLDDLGENFGKEFSVVKNAAIQTVIGTLYELAKRPLADLVNKVADRGEGKSSSPGDLRDRRPRSSSKPAPEYNFETEVG